MPQLQTYTETPNRAEENLQTLFSNLGNQYKDKQDRVEIGKLIDQYEDNKQDANAWEHLQLGLEKSNISPSRRLATQTSLNAMKKNVNDTTKNLNAKSNEFEKSRQKAVGDYVNAAISHGEEAEGQKFALGEARKAIAGDIQGPGFKAAAKHNPYTQLIIGLTPDEAALQAANKKLLEGSKGIFGAKPTEREIFLLLNEMLPSIGKTREANEAGVDFLEKVNEMKILHAKTVEELTEGGTKYIPDLEKQVAEIVKPATAALLEELKEARSKFNGSKEEKKSETRIKVKAPNGSIGSMTQAQIDEAKAKGVNFEPV